MQIDQHTLYDLDIFAKNSGDNSLFDLLDRTKSRGGRERLRKIFSSPKRSQDEIIAMQNMLKFLIKNPNIWAITFNEGFIRKLEKYLYLNIIPITNKNKLLIFIQTFFYRAYYYKLSQGTNTVKDFLKKFKRILERNQGLPLPVELRKQFERIQNLLQLPELEHLLTKYGRHKISFIDVFRYDYIFRCELQAEIMQLMDVYYEIDALLSLAKAIQEFRLTFPQFVEANYPGLKLTELYHLFLTKPTQVDISFKDKHNFLFLTGPNMAGKTTFLKAVGVAVYFAHLGIGVPATKMELTFFDTLFSSINTEDNIRLGYSYFYSEVRRVKAIAKILQKNQRCLIIFDELFKGTNIHDAYDASKLVIQGFTKWFNSLFILSSHLVELETEIKKHSNFFCKYFESRVVDQKPVYSYQLKDGISHDRLGLLILEQEGIMNLLEPGSEE